MQHNTIYGASLTGGYFTKDGGVMLCLNSNAAMRLKQLLCPTWGEVG